jgi:hypothetical protein
VKRLHRDDLYGWSRFQDHIDLDFNGFALVRPAGNLLIDPMPLSPHDLEQLRALGGVAWIVLTNSYHVRDAQRLADAFGARIAGPAQERAGFPIACARWLKDGDELTPGLVAYELDGSKTPGELALVLDETTLISGDLIRAHRPGALQLLAADKLKDVPAVHSSLRRLLARAPKIEAVLVGDGWCCFHDGAAQLSRLIG